MATRMNPDFKLVRDVILLVDPNADWRASKCRRGVSSILNLRYRWTPEKINSVIREMVKQGALYASKRGTWLCLDDVKFPTETARTVSNEVHSGRAFRHVKRVLIMAKLLYKHATVTSKDLMHLVCEKVGKVCKRTIRRDLRVLRELGIAESYMDGNQKLYTIRDSKIDENADLSMDDDVA